MKHINYAIFQLREDMEDNDLIRFASYNSLEKMGVTPTIARYQEVYRGTLTELEDARSNSILEKLYEKFNLRIPEDFRGHRLSVGDIVELNFDGEETFYFVDSIGFRKFENFESAGRSKTNNYKKIKGMNLKELARFLIELTEPGDTIKYCQNLPECDADNESDREIPDERCVKCMMQWLEKEEQR